jgi:hypothetical protein
MKLEVFGFLIEDGKQPLPERRLGHTHALCGVKHVIKSNSYILGNDNKQIIFF